MFTEKITDAQKAGEFDLDGHAKKAKELLRQANQGLKLARDASNKSIEDKKKK